ncbi:MAG TPA: hypothetical protein VL285_21115 [Bryobacteraceae bacterium]|jgi:hypothetical protein|nr:hypothetical protein [Bryobacteraceae bacterium]
MMECTNPGVFSAGPDWLEPGEQRRHEALWQIARGKAEGSGGLREHVEVCRACRELVRAFQQVDRAVGGTAEVFAVCPSERDLADYAAYELPAPIREKVEAHLKACPLCGEDLEWLAATSASKITAIDRRRWISWVGAAAAVALLALIPLLRRSSEPVSPYLDLARIPAINRQDLIGSLRQPQRFRPALEESINAFDAGDFKMAEAKAQPILAASPDDPSALFITAMAEYRLGNASEAERLMDRAERGQPMTEYRCWTALQLGLATGSRPRIDRECAHLERSPGYASQIRQIREQVGRRA